MPKPLRRLPRVEAIDQAVRWILFLVAVGLTCWWYYYLAGLAWTGLVWLTNLPP